MKLKEESVNVGLKLKLRPWHPVRSLLGKEMGNNVNSDRLYFWAPQSQQMVTAAMKLKDACSLEDKL